MSRAIQFEGSPVKKMHVRTVKSDKNSISVSDLQDFRLLKGQEKDVLADHFNQMLQKALRNSQMSSSKSVADLNSYRD